MTHKDIYTKFMIEYDKANITSSYPSLTKYEVATLLDKAYLALIAQKITGNNPRKVGFEADVKAIHDLQPLITTKLLYINNLHAPVAKNEQTYNLPTNILYYIDCQLAHDSLNKTNSSNIETDNTSVQLIDHQHANNFRLSTTNFPWIKTPVCFMQEGRLHVLVDPKFVEDEFYSYLTFVKKPISFTIGKSDSPSDPSTPDNPGGDPDDPDVPGDNPDVPGSGDNPDDNTGSNPDQPGSDGDNPDSGDNPHDPTIPDDDSDQQIEEALIKVSIETFDTDDGSNAGVCGTISGNGIYKIGTLCILIAIPNNEDDIYIYSFEGWKHIDEYVSSDSQYSFTVVGNASYKAVFSRTRKLQFEQDDQVDNPNESDDYWVDLDLPSGTLWGKLYSKDTKFPTYFLRKKSQVDTVLNGMSNSNYDLPTSNLWNELKKYCVQSEINDPALYKKYRYTGRNGNYIEFIGYSGEEGVNYSFFTKNTTVVNGKIPLFSIMENKFIYRDESKKRDCRVRPVKRQMTTVPDGVDANGNVIYKNVNIADQNYYVAATVNPTESGTITNANKSYGYAYIVDVEAKPNDGYRFIRWEDGTTDAKREINVIGPIQLTATFAALGSQDMYHVKIKPNNSDFGYVFSEYDNDVATGTEITIVVMPKEGYKFIGWSDGLPSTSVEELTETRVFVVNNDIDVTANFAEDVQDVPDDETYDAYVACVVKGNGTSHTLIPQIIFNTALNSNKTANIVITNADGTSVQYSKTFNENTSSDNLQNLDTAGSGIIQSNSNWQFDITVQFTDSSFKCYVNKQPCSSIDSSTFPPQITPLT